MLKYSDYQVILTLHDCNSISAAAKKLFVSQPTLTKRLQQIEETLEINIIKRTSSGITFTIEGERLVSYAEDQLNKYNDMLRDLHGFHLGADKIVSVMAPSSLLAHLIPRLLSEFKIKHPDALFNVQYANSNDVAQAVYEQKCDVGFVRGEPSIICEKKAIREETAVVISKEKINLNSLPYMPRIDPEMSESARIFINKWWNNTFDVVPYIAMRVPNIDICVKMVSMGLGYSIIISSDAYEHEENIYVQHLKDNNEKYITRCDYILYRNDKHYNQMTKDFIKFSSEFSQQ